MDILRPFEKPATNREISGILGLYAADTLMDISRVGATRAEIRQAKAWFDDPGHAGEAPGKEISLRAIGVYEILLGERERSATHETG